MKSILFTYSLVFILGINTLSAQTELDSLNKVLDFETISKTEFTHYLLKDVKRVTNEKESDSTFFKKRGLTLIEYCDQVCESYLVDDKTEEKLWLPANFDQGILGMTFSPKKDYLLVFSSYDGPDYNNYYDYRADIYVYKISKTKGIKALEIDFIFTTKDWSIDSMAWINNTSFALKIYEDGRFGNGENLSYKYYKTSFK